MYRIDHHPDHVAIALEGVVGTADILAINEAIAASEAFDRLRYQLWLFADIEDVRISGEQMRSIILRERGLFRRNPTLRVAIVTTSPLIHGMARMYDSLGGDRHFDTGIFPDRQAALAWIEGGARQ